MNMDIEIDTPRGQSNVPSTNSSRKSLAHSSTLSILYAKRMETLNNCPSWAEQVEDSISQSVFYISLNIENTNNANKAIATENMAESHGTHVNSLDTSTCQP